MPCTADELKLMNYIIATYMHIPSQRLTVHLRVVPI